MDASLSEEYRQLELEAWEALREAPRNQRGSRVRMAIRFFPPFESCLAYNLVEEVEHWSILVLTWRRLEDAAKFDNPLTRLRYPQKIQPTITREAATFPADSALRLMNGFRSLRIAPMVVRDQVGLDGESKEIESGNSMGSSHFKWWGDAPGEWKELEERVDAARRDFDRALQASG